MHFYSVHDIKRGDKLHFLNGSVLVVEMFCLQYCPKSGNAVVLFSPAPWKYELTIPFDQIIKHEQATVSEAA